MHLIRRKKSKMNFSESLRDLIRIQMTSLLKRCLWGRRKIIMFHILSNYRINEGNNQFVIHNTEILDELASMNIPPLSTYKAQIK